MLLEVALFALSATQPLDTGRYETMSREQLQRARGELQAKKPGFELPIAAFAAGLGVGGATFGALGYLAYRYGNVALLIAGGVAGGALLGVGVLVGAVLLHRVSAERDDIDAELQLIDARLGALTLPRAAGTALSLRF